MYVRETLGILAVPTKTITVDLEAYRRLESVKRDNESFSEAIKRTIPPPFDLEAYRRRLESLSLSEKAAEAIEEQILRRRRPGITDQ